jgi:hypothetical protein
MIIANDEKIDSGMFEVMINRAIKVSLGLEA